MRFDLAHVLTNIDISHNNSPTITLAARAIPLATVYFNISLASKPMPKFAVAQQYDLYRVVEPRLDFTPQRDLGTGVAMPLYPSDVSASS